MFLALKNALGRTAVFFRGLLDEYGGSAAAYSLRRLGSAYSGPIVKVRRDSDQEELDFTSVSGVEDWVNGKQETTLPADIATSAAAYGLRKLRSAYTGDAVHIRRSSDDVEVNVQFDSNDKVSASSLIEQAELGLNRAGVILFDGVDDDIDVNTALLPTTDFTLTINAYVTAYPSSDATILGQGTASGTGRTVLQIQNDGQLFVFLNGVGSFTTSNTFNLNEINTIVFSRSGDDYSLTLNGGTASTQTSSGSPQQVNSQIGDGYSGANFKGSIQSLTVGAVSWNGKQSQAESLGWTVNGSPQLSVIVPTTLGDFLTEDTTFIAYDFSSSTDGFVFPANVTLTAGQSIGGESDALKLSVVETVVATVHRTYDIISPIGTGTNFQITFKAYRPSSNVDSGKLGISFAGGILSGNVGPQFFTADDTWEDFTFEQSSGNTNRFYLQLSATDGVGGTKSIFNGTTGDHLFIKDLKIEAVEHSASVVTWYDQSASANHATQTVAGDQPKIAEAGALIAPRHLRHIETATLPDASQGTAAGKGFTITGLTYDASENCFWAINFGDDIEPVSGTLYPSVVKLSLTFELISEIDLTPIVDSAESAQGIAVDTSNNSLWIALAPATDDVININKQGSLLSTVSLADSSGLAYDPTDDTLWTIDDGSANLNHYSKTGTLLDSYSVPFSGADHLTYDAATDSIWCSNGGNGSIGNVSVFHKDTEQFDDRIPLSADTLAVEGLAIVGNKLFVGNDGYFHNSASTNTIQTFNISNGVAIDFGDANVKLTVDTLSEELTGASTAIAALRYPVTSTQMAFSGTSSSSRRTTFRASGKYALFAGSSATTAAGIGPASEVPSLAFATFSGTGLGSLYGDGVLRIDQQSVGSNNQAGLTIGEDNDGSPTFAGHFYELILYNSDQTSNRFKIESNINNYHDIYTAAEDGYVRTWYDQSGNSNDATQATQNNQPKIVNGGSLVSGGLDFDGSDDFFETSLVPPNVATLIGVANWDVEDQTGVIIGARDSTNQRSYLAQVSTGKLALGVTSSAISGVDAVAGDDYLLFGIHSGSTRLLSTNGSVVSDSSGSAPNNNTYGYNIGANNTAGVVSAYMEGTIAEIIIYDSDQSANRTGIESNIAEEYGITLP
jgi:hypothetical protein